jgi:PHD/YefM family antitoxin component YafN of YafNO toxin-antitoxin module
MNEVSLETIYREIKDLRMLIESLAETIDVLSNPKELKGILRGLMDVKKGRVRSWMNLNKN